MKLPARQIARIAHEANRAYCVSLGDISQPVWDRAPAWQQDSAVNGVVHVLGNPDCGPEDSHASWLAEKIKEGWRWGEIKDPVLKEHPCMVPYEQLPVAQRRKDALFLGVVKALLWGTPEDCAS